MSTDTTEKGLESLIVKSLIEESGYIQGDSRDYDREYAVDLAKLKAFLQATQPEKLEALRLDPASFHPSPFPPHPSPLTLHNFCTACRARLPSAA